MAVDDLVDEVKDAVGALPLVLQLEGIVNDSVIRLRPLSLAPSPIP